MAMWQIFAVFCIFILEVTGKPKQDPIILTEENWVDMLEGEWLVKFYAPWCPACKALSPVWSSVAGWSEDMGVKIAHIDVTENPGLSGRFIVTSLPTIFHVKNGDFRTYKGSRDENKIISFVDDEDWKEIDPIPWYKSPNSPQMATVGLFFQAAMHIRNVHSSMTEEYGVPVWGSYGIFAILTIFIGLILGLVLVCICDTVFPPSPITPPLPKQYKALRRETHNHNGNFQDDTKDNDSDIIDDRQDPVGAEQQDAAEAPAKEGTRKRQPRID